MTYRITATIEDGANDIIRVEASAHVKTTEQAELIAASFPKFVRVKSSGCCGFPTQERIAALGLSVDGHGMSTKSWGLVTCDFRFYPDAVNKGKNEAGLKRLRAFLKIVAWEYDATVYGNSATREQFDAFIR